jgi:hypothetical protein
MISHTPLTNPPAPPSRTQPPVCMSCAEGDHDRVPLSGQCSCPCHGTARQDGGELT